MKILCWRPNAVCFELGVSGSQAEKWTSNHETHKARHFPCNPTNHWWDKRSKRPGTYSLGTQCMSDTLLRPVQQVDRENHCCFCLWQICFLLLLAPLSVVYVWVTITVPCSYWGTQGIHPDLPQPHYPILLTSVRAQGWALEPILANQNPSQGIHRWPLERDVLSFLLDLIVKDVIPEHQAASTWQKPIWIVGK